MKFERSEKITVAVLGFVLAAGIAGTVYISKNADTENTPLSPAAQTLFSTDGHQGYTDLDGNPVLLSEFEGSYIVVTSWATWCPSCITQLRELQSLQAKYRSQNIKVVAINRAEPAETAKRFVEVFPDSANIQLILDPDDFFYTSINGYTMPETVVYDPAGAIAFRIHGEDTRSQMEAAILKLLP